MHEPPHSQPRPAATDGRRAPGRRLLITAGPTHEPIDAVRFIGNRSSGRLGVALAERAAIDGWDCVLLLGPTCIECRDTRVTVERFQTTSELQNLLRSHLPTCDVLVMAAAVADYRPAPGSASPASGKIRRGDAPLTLALEPTPDLLAGCARARRADQTLVGFALEPRDRLLDSARSKLERKGVDAIVANPLETMDAEMIEASILWRDGGLSSTPGPIDKRDFAPWLLKEIERWRSAASRS